ncbi:short chain dehydrogenase/reductase family [Acanthamoeba castellanii str. Neff]|uniref:Short chain dehydrogenase/reductase family n=1 Tax=Acanthamoeba castellanii (strain ATCC 30010 / Neff) TaxID=1257118 RepID=L8HAD9_ACACF|nr:short chain dehydrogenase/reductase family [Acanthamoeba castellanii str. Neff]ELR21401.1 short chain dehydrogenase/reductase family [Acanthamoeba castellanii str. Neff]
MEIDKLFGVKGKVVLVTGGGRGIGFMISQGFVRNGATVYIASRSKKECDKAAEELTAAGPGKCVALSSANISTAEGRKKVVEELSSLEDHLDILVNNSGCTWGMPIEDFTESAWDKVMDLNVKALFFLTRDLLPLLQKKATAVDPARVINLGSIDGIRIPTLETYPYSASKAAVHQLTRVLANRLASMNITVNAVAAGPFESKMMAETLRTFGELLKANVPRGRIGEPEDIAGACIFLGSRAGAFLTGAVIPLEGGILSAARL